MSELNTSLNPSSALNPVSTLTRNKAATPANSREELEARRVAQEFEALLLTQLTATLGPSATEDEEGGLMQSDSMDMYQKMFSEQMATQMAKQGGVGLTDFMLQHIQSKKDAAQEMGKKIEGATQRAIDTARFVRNESQPATNLNDVALPVSANVPAPANSETVRPLTTASTSASATRPRRVFADPTNPASVSVPRPLFHEDGSAHLPVQGHVSSMFGTRRDPITGGHRFHKGVDIAAPKGSPIGAFSSGKVIFAGRQGGYGNTVVIEHADGRQTRYAHAERLMVQSGDYVRTGQTIATVGSTGRSTGPHLHFEVSQNGRQIDPLRALANENALARR